MKAIITTRRASGPMSSLVPTAVEVLGKSGLVALPTDTLYGLAANALDELAIEKVFIAKNRPNNMALPILVSERSDLYRFGVDVPTSACKLVTRFWPGQLTIIVRKASIIPDVLTGNADTVALRLPDSQLVVDIVRRLGGPITGTSANRSGFGPAVTAEEVVQQLGGKIDLVIDLDRDQSQVVKPVEASTIVDVTDTPLRIKRIGPISLKEIRDTCGEHVETDLGE